MTGTSAERCPHDPDGWCLRCLSGDMGRAASRMAHLAERQEADTGEIEWSEAPTRETGLYLYRESSGATSFDKWTLCVIFLTDSLDGKGNGRAMRMLTPPAHLGNHPIPTRGQFAGPIPLEGFTRLRGQA